MNVKITFAKIVEFFLSMIWKLMREKERKNIAQKNWNDSCATSAFFILSNNDDNNNKKYVFFVHLKKYIEAK